MAAAMACITALLRAFKAFGRLSRMMATRPSRSTKTTSASALSDIRDFPFSVHYPASSAADHGGKPGQDAGEILLRAAFSHEPGIKFRGILPKRRFSANACSRFLAEIEVLQH